MPYCPVCRMEYESSVQVCPEDNVPLVPVLPPPPPPMPDDASPIESTEEMVAEHGMKDPVAVRTVDDEPVARVIASILIREGVPAAVQTGEPTGEGAFPTTFAPWYVFVEREDVPKALEILAAVPEDELAAAAESEAPPPDL